MYQRIRNLLLCLILLVMYLGLPVAEVRAQSGGSTTAGITGVVIDEEGAVVGGVSVTIKNLETNVSRELVSSEDGRYLAVQLAPGNYEISASVEGFTTQTSKVNLALGVNTEVNFIMRIGATSEIIEIQASNLMEVGRTENSTNIDRGRIDSLPINRRNFLDFSLTTPRVTADRVPSQGASNTSGLSVNGQTARANNITIDGLDNNDLASNSVRSTFSQDAVQEFQVVSDSYSAEFGRALGGVINIVTRGGGNEYRGTLFYFNRNDDTSARDVFAPFEPEFRQYQFGASLSGPIKKNKAFYFASFERLSVAQNNFVTISNDTINSIRNVGFSISNGPLGQSIGTTTGLIRTDFQINSKDSIYVRYNFGGSTNSALEPFGGLVAQSNSGIQRLDDNSIAFTNNYLNTSLNLVNETRFLYGRRNQEISAVDPGPQVRIIAPEGQVTFGRSTFLPQFRQQRNYQIVNNTTLTRGRQTLRFGVDYIFADLPDKKTNVPIFPGGLAFFVPIDFSSALGIPNLPFFTGIEAFDPNRRSPAQKAFLAVAATQLPLLVPGFPVLPLADLPLPGAYIQGFGDTSLIVPQNLFSFFVQDEVKLRPNLLVKAGLRYDLNRVRFQPDNSGNFSPRIGLSYRPKSLERLNLRASYGIFFAGIQVAGAAFAVQTTTGTNPPTLTLPLNFFPISILPFIQQGRKFPDSNSVPAGLPVLPQLTQSFRYQKGLRNSYTQQASLGVEYLIGQDTIVSAGYQYVRGIKLFSVRNINTIANPTTGNPTLNALTGRVDPTKGDIFEFESAFDSYFHSLTLLVNRRFNKRFGVLASYTFSKSIDNFIDVRTDLQETVDPLNPRQERGLSLQDTRSRFVLSAVADVGYGKSPFLSGYQLSTIVSLNSGRPYNLLAGVDLNRNNDNPVGDRPLIGGTPIARNSGLTPGFANVDLRLTKTISYKERYKFQAFAEIFNLFNRVNINDVSRIFPPDAQGNFNLPPKDGGRFTATPQQFVSAFSPRQIQLGLRVSF
ncbi:MAG: TonB-dependent receptor [Acidobacteria bacterium]|nr:TonB-dependent receptor [Acidobacteriota bacterium]